MDNGLNGTLGASAAHPAMEEFKLVSVDAMTLPLSMVEIIALVVIKISEFVTHICVQNIESLRLGPHGCWSTLLKMDFSSSATEQRAAQMSLM